MKILIVQIIILEFAELWKNNGGILVNLTNLYGVKITWLNPLENVVQNIILVDSNKCYSFQLLLFLLKWKYIEMSFAIK